MAMRSESSGSSPAVQFFKDWQGIFQWIVSSGAANAADLLRVQDDLWRLKTTLLRVAIAADEAEWWLFVHPGVGDLLAKLKDAAYDAEDVLDDLNYQEMQLQKEGRYGQASQLLSSSVDFFRSWLLGQESKVKNILGKLDHAAAELKEALDHLGSRPGAAEHCRRPPTSSYFDNFQVLGRDEELKKLIDLLAPQRNQRSPAESSASAPKRRRMGEVRVDVLPIVGMGGVGKTTLAQKVYNHPRVRNHFKEQRFWVSVSDDFDVTRITKEIIGCACPEQQFESTNLNYIQGILVNTLKSKVFMLVLDDVWTEDSVEWQRFYTPFADLAKGSMILVTTRSKKAAGILGSKEPLFLEGLPLKTYIKFFRRCAFGSRRPQKLHSSNDQLEQICLSIAAKLDGSPLAAKTVGALLSSDIREEHWNQVKHSELWELNQKKSDILPALQLSYRYLPPHLRKCFSFCSIFPRSYKFQKEELVDMWLALGFLVPEGRLRKEDIAAKYLDDLTSRYFFHKTDDQCYVIHSLMHDVARSASVPLCLLLWNNLNKVPSVVRHLSVCVEAGNKLTELDSCKKLHSLVTIGPLHFDLTYVTRHLTSIRCLKLDGDITKLPENIGNLRHLRYLHIYKSAITTFPASFYRLYNLQVLYLRLVVGCNNTYFQSNLSMLTKLRKFYPDTLLSRVSWIGKMTSLQTLHSFEVLNKDGHRIDELKNMKQLHGSLQIINLENVGSGTQATQAEMKTKKYLTGLTLQWSKRNASLGNRDCDCDVLEGLQPHSGLKLLEIRSYEGPRLSQWLNAQNLPCLESLFLCDCRNLNNVPCLPPSIKKLHLVNVGIDKIPRVWECNQQIINNGSRCSLTDLLIARCCNLTSLSEWLVPQHVPFIKSFEVVNCNKLLSLPVENFRGLSSLEKLKLVGLPKLECEGTLQLPSTLKEIELRSNVTFGNWFPQSLVELTSLSTMKLIHNPDIKSLDDPILHRFTFLEHLTLEDCQNLKELKGLEVLTSLKSLHIINCPISNSTGHASAQTEGAGLLNLRYLTLDDTRLLNQVCLQSALPYLVNIKIWNSQEECIFSEVKQEVFQRLEPLRGLCVQSCKKLRSISTTSTMLRSLQTFAISDCCLIETAPHLPLSIRVIQVSNCSEKFKKELEQYQAQLRPFSPEFWTSEQKPLGYSTTSDFRA